VTRARIEAGLERLSRLVETSKLLADATAAVAARYAGVLRGGGTLFFCGNGGSAADAQHLATEYVVRYSNTRRPLAAIALTTDSSILTAAGNDLGFEQVFARQVEALCGPGDLLILHSASGRSANLLHAARAAKNKGAGTVAFLGGGGGELASLVDQALVVPSNITSEIQVMHLALEHLVVELVEEDLARAP
jgi:D-sedoheptulose 7-phosphate isomerase